MSECRDCTPNDHLVDSIVDAVPELQLSGTDGARILDAVLSDVPLLMHAIGAEQERAAICACGKSRVRHLLKGEWFYWRKIDWHRWVTEWREIQP